MAHFDYVYSPIPSATLLDLADTFWATNPASGYTAHNLQPYAEYYTEQCRTFYHTPGAKFPLIKHTEVIQLGQDIRRGLTREQLILKLRERYVNRASNEKIPEETMERIVNLVARLLIMVDVGQPATNRMWTGRAYRLWKTGTIRDFTASIFPMQRENRDDEIRLDLDFNARNLDVIGGLKVELTNNLLDHLKVVDIEGHTTVMVFHHVCFLKNQQEQLFPDNFVYETLQTLALLFPQNKWYKRSKTWYHKYLEPTTEDADLDVLSCGPLTMTSINDYKYWNDRLVRLKQIFDQAKPGTLRQWWNDRREGTQWYALWVAVGFTVFFGLVQSIEGALQVYKAYNP